MNPKRSNVGTTRRLVQRMSLGIRVLTEALMRPPLRMLFWWERRERSSGKINELAFMYAFLFKHLARICPGRVLDVGTGTSSLPHLMSHCGAETVAIDRFRGYWGRRPLNRHFDVISDDICGSRIQGTFDLITCIDVIQHLPEHMAAIQTIAGLLRPGGALVIGCCYNENHYVPDAYCLAGSNAFNRNAGHRCQIISRKEVEAWVQSTGLRIVDQELWSCFTGEYWSLGERLQPARRTNSGEPHHAICLCLEKSGNRPVAGSAGHER